MRAPAELRTAKGLYVGLALSAIIWLLAFVIAGPFL